MRKQQLLKSAPDPPLADLDANIAPLRESVQIMILAQRHFTDFHETLADFKIKDLRGYWTNNKFLPDFRS